MTDGINNTDITPAQPAAPVPDSYGVKPAQSLEGFGEIIEQAGQSQGMLQDAGQNIADVLTQRYPGLFPDLEFSQGPLKQEDRAAVKLLGDSGNALDPAKAPEIVDLVRGRIVIDTADQVRAIREVLADPELRESLGIEYAKDRFAKPSDTHYRDINLSVRLPNGHVAEIQINQRDMMAAAEFTHDPYEDADAIRKRAQIEGRTVTPEELDEIERLQNFSQDAHDMGAARFEGADDLLSEAGRAKLDKDYAGRLAADPAYVPGETIQSGHKYDALIVDGALPIDESKYAYGGIGAKELTRQAGIEVDGITLDMLDNSALAAQTPAISHEPAANIPDAPHIAAESGALSFTEQLGRRAGIIGGVVVAGALAVSGASAGEVALGTAEATIPGVSSAVALEEGRYAEAGMRGVEEVPVLGLAASEIVRPIARGAGYDMDPSLLAMALASEPREISPEQKKFWDVYDNLPAAATDDMPPEVAGLVELKGAIERGEASIRDAAPEHREAAIEATIAVEDRYSVLYDDLTDNEGIAEVENWIAANAAATPQAPAPAEPVMEIADLDNTGQTNALPVPRR